MAAWQCPTCGRRDQKSKEHVLSQWLHKHWRTTPERPQPNYIKVFMCEPCNGYFNTQLEIPCGPTITKMMKAESFQIDSAMQRLLAAYFTKFSLLMSIWPHYPDGNDPFIRIQDLRKFRQGLVLPRGSGVV